MKPIDVAITDYPQMVQSFQGESDRGAAVLAGSYVENFLGLYLRSCMVDLTLAEKMFLSNGPLSTFSQRIDFAQAFGLLSFGACKDLHLIRRIRNHFAHYPLDASFTKSPVREWVTELISSRTEVPMEGGGAFKLDDGKTAYLVSAGLFVAFAHDKMQGKNRERRHRE